jgi:hypothetical protein
MYEAFFVSYFPMKKAEEIAVFLNPYAFDPQPHSPGSPDPVPGTIFFIRLCKNKKGIDTYLL